MLYRKWNAAILTGSLPSIAFNHSFLSSSLSAWNVKITPGFWMNVRSKQNRFSKSETRLVQESSVKTSFDDCWYLEILFSNVIQLIYLLFHTTHRTSRYLIILQHGELLLLFLISTIILRPCCCEGLCNNIQKVFIIFMMILAECDSKQITHFSPSKTDNPVLWIPFPILFLYP